VKVEKVRIPTDEITCTPLKRSNQIFVIIRIFLDRPEFQTAFGRFSNQREGNDPTINLLIREGKIPAYSWIFQTASNLIEDRIGPNEMKDLIV
jgi:hypothetical protein